MENYSKVVNDAINKIDWNVVKMFYKELESISTKKKVHFQAKSLADIKKELRNLIEFAIEGNCREVRHDQWIVSWKDDYKTGTFNLEVFFVACKATTKNEVERDDDDLNPDLVEQGVLKNMLDKSVREENYELASVIHKRLGKLDKILKKKQR
jgi:hypothetical protein